MSSSFEVDPDGCDSHELAIASSRNLRVDSF